MHGKVLCLANIKGTVQMLCDAPDGGLQDSGVGGDYSSDEYKYELMYTL